MISAYHKIYILQLKCNKDSLNALLTIFVAQVSGTHHWSIHPHILPLGDDRIEYSLDVNSCLLIKSSLVFK